MSTLLILSVLSAAFLHAFWNFQVKDTPNKAMGMAAVMFGHLPLAGIGLLYSGLPSLEAGPYLIASDKTTGGAGKQKPDQFCIGKAILFNTKTNNGGRYYHNAEDLRRPEHFI